MLSPRQYIKAIFIITCVNIISRTVAKIFDRCELARELLQRDVSKADILEWVCIAEYESTFNTEAINRYNSDGSWDWGLFQLNDRYWCDGDKQTANVCRTKCQNFLTSDIGIAFNCALKVKREHGFAGWVAWRNRCQGNVPSKQETAECLR